MQAEDSYRLMKVHGEPAKSSHQANGGLALLKLKLSHEGETVERSLPETVTVQRLIGIFSRLFHLEARKVS